MPTLNPDIADEVPWSDTITDYDVDHLVTYLRLLDAEEDQADWRDVAKIVLHRDPDLDPQLTQRCWEAHLKRARWMTVSGYRHLLIRAAANS